MSFPPKYTAGSRVRVSRCTNSHGVPLGSVVTLEKYCGQGAHGDARWYSKEWSSGGCRLREDDLDPCCETPDKDCLFA